MNRRQYKNIIKGSLKQCESKNITTHLEQIKVVMKNLGVAFPQGDRTEIIDSFSSNDYMGWKKCSPMEAVEFVNNGTIAIGISDTDSVMLLSNMDEINEVDTTTLMVIDENTTVAAINDMSLFAFSPSTTTTTTTTTTTSPSIPTNTFNKDYIGNNIFTEKQLDRIKENEAVYKKTADKYDIPWQIMAVLHCRENNFSRYAKTNQGLYGDTSCQWPIGEYTEELFQQATDKAAEAFLSNIPDRNLHIDDDVKYSFFRYNGCAKVYKNQAINLGFTQAQADIGEGSPYVMNRADARRDPTVEPTKSNNTWGQIKRDGGPIEYPANDDYGAYVMFKALF